MTIFQFAGVLILAGPWSPVVACYGGTPNQKSDPPPQRQVERAVQLALSTELGTKPKGTEVTILLCGLRTECLPSLPDIQVTVLTEWPKSSDDASEHFVYFVPAIKQVGDRFEITVSRWLHGSASSVVYKVWTGPNGEKIELIDATTDIQSKPPCFQDTPPN